MGHGGSAGRQGRKELVEYDDATLRVDILDTEKEEGVTLQNLTFSGDTFNYEKLTDDEASVS